MNPEDINKSLQSMGKTAELINNILQPINTVRLAKAEIKAEDMKQAARFKREELEILKQQNLEAIANKANNYLVDIDINEKIDVDWAVNFLEKAANYSDEDMQYIWARILAEELKVPGSYSRKTINILNDLDKQDAELFTRICSFGVILNDEIHPTLLMYDINKSSNDSEPYAMGKSDIVQLDALGLIRYETWTSFSRKDLPPSFKIKYFSESICINTFSKHFVTGYVLFTQCGLELYRIVETKRDLDFWADIRKQIVTHNKNAVFP